MLSLLEGTPTRLPGSPASVYPRRVVARRAVRHKNVMRSGEIVMRP
jgi:hypothetical protein